MKNVILSLAFLFFAGGLAAQAKAGETPAKKTTEKLVQLYNLTSGQQAEVLKTQERKYRNLAEIEQLKATDQELYAQKVRALQFANDKSLERILTKSQIPLLRQQQKALREQKALANKELKATGASQEEINSKMLEIDLESLQ